MNQINEINWYPGHMQKAIRRIQEKLKQCDGVIEICDARAPFSSYPDYLDKITQGKAKVVVFSKIDLADPVLFEKHKAQLKAKGVEPFSYDLRDKKSGKELLRYLSLVRTSQDRRFEKLKLPLPIKRFIVLDIPKLLYKLKNWKHYLIGLGFGAGIILFDIFYLLEISLS